MSPTTSCCAFATSSPFIAACAPPPRPAICSSRGGPAMLDPQPVRRDEEIKRLTQKLHELRISRQNLANGVQNSTQPAPSTAVPGPKDSAPPPTAHPPVSSSFQLGKHAQNSHFLSLSNVEHDEYLPRLLPVAGSVPGLTTDTFRHTPQVTYSKAPRPANVFRIALPSGFDGEYMAVPCTSVLSDCKDPVIVLVDPEHASVASLPLPPNEPVAVVVDRHVSDITFNRDKFYAWDVRGQIRIGWAAEIPHPTQAVIIGQVAYGILEIDEQLRRKRSCWEEENGVYS